MATLARDVTFNVTTAAGGTATGAGTDYTLPTLVTFAAGALNAATRSANLAILNDSFVEGSETANLALEVKGIDKVAVRAYRVDLRTLFPLDEEAMYDLAKRHGKCLVVTEEPVSCTFAQSLAARISEHCFQWLDAPVRTIGAANMPAVPLNEVLEREMIPSAEKVAVAMGDLLAW